MLIKLIFKARMAKMDWLRARFMSIGCNEILLKVISGKTVIVILEQRLSQCYLAVDFWLHNI